MPLEAGSGVQPCGRSRQVRTWRRCKLLCVEHGQPYEAIIDTAKKGGRDLIVMASHGLSGISASMLGSEIPSRC
jgi:hypothetical protein